VKGAQLGVLEEDRTAAPGEIDITFDVAAGDEASALQKQRVLEASQIHAVEQRARAVAAESLGLRAKVGRRVVQRDVLENEVGRVNAEHRSKQTGDPAVVVIGCLRTG
jgi:hypothetical protein